MTISGRNLRQRLCGRVWELKNRLSRARYFRGHGVHSPFVYDIVRRVFMCDVLLPGDHALFAALIARNVPCCRAVQLQNLYTHCGCASFCFDSSDAEFCVVTRDLPGAAVCEILRAAALRGTTVAVLTPYEGRERQQLCRRIVAEHAVTTVDNRGYLLIFNNHLPKQHFRI